MLFRSTETLNTFGVARFPVSNLATGKHTITASYAGDANFKAQNTASFVEVIQASNYQGVLQSSSGASGKRAADQGRKPGCQRRDHFPGWRHHVRSRDA